MKKVPLEKEIYRTLLRRPKIEKFRSTYVYWYLVGVCLLE